MRQFTMVGTEKTGKYVGVATSRAQVGYRVLGNNVYRVRVEPVESEREALAAVFGGWKIGFGGSEYRFSMVVIGHNLLQASVFNALKAIKAKGRVVASVNCPDWLLKAAKAAKPETEKQERKRLVAAVKAKKLPGSNLAVRWSLATLRNKVAAK